MLDFDELRHPDIIDRLVQLALTPGKKIVVLSGPSCCGKTVIQHVFSKRLEALGCTPILTPENWIRTDATDDDEATLSPPAYPGESIYDRCFRKCGYVEPVILVAGDALLNKDLDRALDNLTQVENYRMILVQSMENPTIKHPVVHIAVPPSTDDTFTNLVDNAQ